jgi:hypothetical protein
MKYLMMGLLLLMSLLYGGSASSDVGTCGTFEVRFTPALSRPGETVPIQIGLEGINCQPAPCYNDVSILIYFPNGLRVDADGVRPLLQPRGIFRTANLFPLNLPASNQVQIGAQVNPKVNNGPAFEMSVKTDESLSPILLTMTTGRSLVSGGIDNCAESGSDTGTVQVTGPGTGRGDVDGDGSVNTTDVQWALRLLLNTVTASPGVLKSADAWPEGGDGQITLSDALSVLRLAVGLE